MKQYQKGFIVPFLIIIIAVLAVGGGAYVYQQKQKTTPLPTLRDRSTTTVEKATVKNIISNSASVTVTPKANITVNSKTTCGSIATLSDNITPTQKSALSCVTNALTNCTSGQITPTDLSRINGRVGNTCSITYQTQKTVNPTTCSYPIDVIGEIKANVSNQGSIEKNEFYFIATMITIPFANNGDYTDPSTGKVSHISCSSK